MSIKSKYIFLLTLLYGVGILFFVPQIAQAATLSVVPASASGNYTVGQVFSVSVLVSTVSSDPLNAVSGVVSFPANILQVVSIDKSNSIIDFWIGDPSYSNSEGTISFEGGSYNPGFSGAGGKVVTILFKAKTAGVATLSFLSSSILANDGRGTNILDKANPTTITVTVSQIVPINTADTVGSQALSVHSSTHPDSTKWYSAQEANVSWKLPKGATAVRTKLDQSPSSIPSVMYSPPVLEKDVELTKDGIWYFHVQARDDNGWGSVTHFKIQIDTTPPNPFNVTFPHGSTTDDPRPVILFNTTDDLSGIGYYDVSVGGANAVRVDHDLVKSNPYVVPDQDHGERAVKVVAYDKAGNATFATSSFMVSSMQQPIFDKIQDTINEGDSLQFSGTVDPKTTLTIFIKDRQGNELSQSIIAGAVTGRFLLVWSKYLPSGVYVMTAQVTDDRGAKSILTPEQIITVRSPVLTRVGVPILNYVTFLVIILGSIAGVIAWLFYLAHLLRKFRRRLDTRLKKADEDIRGDFKKFAKVLSTHVKALEKASTKRILTNEESKLVTALQEALKEMEDEVEKDVREIGE